MRLSEAYNRKNLIDENWVVNKLKQEWKIVRDSYLWSADVELYGKTVWVKLFFGYMKEFQPRATYYSSFGINSKNTNEFYPIMVDCCWGQAQPDTSDVIWYYCDRIQARLFPNGPRNKIEFII